MNGLYLKFGVWATTKLIHMKALFTYFTLLIFVTGVQDLRGQENLAGQDSRNKVESKAPNSLFSGKETAGLKNGTELEKVDDRDHTTENPAVYSHHNARRTFMNLLVAAGLNNVVENGESIGDSDFELGGSRFFEIGLTWNTRVFDDANWLRLKYGFSFQFNGLKPTDNRFFVENEELTELEVYPRDLDKAKFRMDNLVIPVHFEFGPSTKIEKDGRVSYDTYKKFKIGVGGYAGYAIGERQKLKYSNNRNQVKEKQKGDFNTDDFIYGISSYIGWGATSLYAKYDLNTIFEEPNEDLNNISLGVRFDLN